MPVPSEADWRTIAEEYRELWNFPHCVGAVDGKHVVIQFPANSGTLYSNYKGSYSIVFLAVVDARCRFRLVDIGTYGGSSDVLSSSVLGQALRDASLSIPPDQHLPGAEHLGPLPHVFIGDEAFPLLHNLIRPYSEENLPLEHCLINDRLANARIPVECAFGILASQFHIFHRVMGVEPAAAEMFVKAACILHNFMRWDLSEDIPISFGDDGAGEGLLPLQHLGNINFSSKALSNRSKFAEYFSFCDGSVWQEVVV